MQGITSIDYLYVSLFQIHIYRAQRDLNPRPTAPQAVILSKLNYEPTYVPSYGEL